MWFQKHIYDFTICCAPGIYRVKKPDRVNRLNQRHIWKYHLELVRLKMADEMPLDIRHIIRLSPLGTYLLKTLYLGLKFLRTALRKNPLSSLICLFNGIERVEFRNCHQLYSCWQF